MKNPLRFFATFRMTFILVWYVFMKLWIGLVTFYGLVKETRDALKKKATQQSSVMEVLFFHTVLAFLMTGEKTGTKRRGTVPCLFFLCDLQKIKP